MFSLIITVISIALVAALAVASVYYLGGQVETGRSKAAAAEYLNAGEVIKGAINMYRVYHGNSMPADLNELVTTEYLSSIPPGAWSLNGENVVQDDVTIGTCETVNLMVNNVSTIYNCDPSIANGAGLTLADGQPGCCDTTDSQ